MTKLISHQIHQSFSNMKMKEETLMEEKRVIKELKQGRELVNRLMNNLKNPSSKESNMRLISGILRSYENSIVMMSLDQKTRKRSPETKRMDPSNKKKRRTSEKKTSEKVKVCVGREQEGTSQLDDGFCWRKYGQKDIHGSKNPRGYYRCTHRFTRGCLAVKQVQKSDADSSCYEVKYLESHTCNGNFLLSTTKHSVSLFKEEERNIVPKLHHVREQSEDIIKHMKSEELMLSLDDLENKKKIFRTFSFSNPETENTTGWKNLMENFSPTTTSESGITNELISASVANSPTDDSCFSSLKNILDLSYDWSLM
ncbi:PREDICTED: probable WRKY transcription factor 46 [Camelina sativa]|uniref:Probable WRKY transcription factor 46 n=1 Tax=Camelina sativa TaxID=90675 RepID=A0ABM0WCI3_CAMSA|nr:PREDICTED: probable WRKY transcription factor 46 [Camelina sativa]